METPIINNKLETPTTSAVKSGVFSYLNLSHNFRQKAIDILLLTTLVLLMVACLYILKWNSFLLIILLLVNVVVYISYRYEFSVPGISHLGQRYIKSSTQGFSQINASYFHFRFFYYLILLAYDIDSGFNLLLDHTNSLDIAQQSKTKMSAKELEVKQAYFQEGLDLHRTKKRRATMISLISSILLTVVILLIALMFGSNTKAESLGWLQTDWSGGVSSGLLLAADNNVNWNNYSFHDAGVQGTLGKVSLMATSTLFSYAAATDFAANQSENATIVAGALVIAKPAQAACSSDAECGDNSCVSGRCFACGQDTVAYAGGPFDSNGKTQKVGGFYRTVLIGGQCWLKDNLNVGTPIGTKLADNISTQQQADNGRIEKFCYNYVQEGNAAQLAAGTSDCQLYGGLYQWPEALQYAGNTTVYTGNNLPSGNIRGICPSGWHLPDAAEFSTLAGYLGNDKSAGAKLKEAGWIHWFSGDETAAAGTNESGFTAFAGGYRHSSGAFFGRYSFAGFWSTELDGNNYVQARYRELTPANSFATNATYRSAGLSVRCLQDSVEAKISNSATSTSPVIDLKSAAISQVVNWTASTTVGLTAVKVEVRSGTTIEPTDGLDSAWTNWTEIQNGEILHTDLARRYFQYRIILASLADDRSPSVMTFTIARVAYPTAATLVSSPYDSGSLKDILARITWTGTRDSKNTSIKFQLRSAESTSSLATALWCGYDDVGDACSGTKYFSEADNGRLINNLNHPLLSGADDRYFQYRIIFNSDGLTSPEVNSVNVAW